MKRLILLVVIAFAHNCLMAQDTWKERADFFEVFNLVLLAAQEGNTEPVIQKIDELKSKCFAFTRNAREKLASTDKEINKKATLLSEQMTLIAIIIKRKEFNAETMYGELVILHNRFRKILINDEEPQISKELLKRFQKEEKNYLAKKKEIYSANGWH